MWAAHTLVAVVEWDILAVDILEPYQPGEDSLVVDILMADSPAEDYPGVGNLEEDSFEVESP